MKTIKIGTVKKRDPLIPWVGMCFICPECEGMFEFEIKDFKNYSDNHDRFFKCETPHCDEYIYLQTNPTKIINFRGENIEVSKNSIDKW